jgi:hypothetical protein
MAPSKFQASELPGDSHSHAANCAAMNECQPPKQSCCNSTIHIVGSRENAHLRPGLPTNMSAVAPDGATSLKSSITDLPSAVRMLIAEDALSDSFGRFSM